MKNKNLIPVPLIIDAGTESPEIQTWENTDNGSTYTKTLSDPYPNWTISFYLKIPTKNPEQVLGNINDKSIFVPSAIIVRCQLFHYPLLFQVAKETQALYRAPIYYRPTHDLDQPLSPPKGVKGVLKNDQELRRLVEKLLK